MKKEENPMMKEEEESVKWAKYYSSSHHILLVGEGDFSFSVSLADSFDSATNIVATSLDPRDVVIKKYRRAGSNLEKLEKLGATILHGVNATKMKLHTDLRMQKFDRIIFNFPHAGFHGKEEEMHQIRLHRNLVRGFFKCASQMLRPYGEIHINHKTTKPFCCWKLEELASKCYLGLLECVKFERTDYPGYQNKRGVGPRCDEPFHLGECSTFKSGIMHRHHQHKKQAKMGCMHEESLCERPVTREGDLRIEPPTHHNSMQVIAEIQFGNPRISPRINELPASHTMPMQGMPIRQYTDPSISTRSNVLSAYHPLIIYKAPAMEHRNSQVFSRLDHAVSTSHPSAYKFPVQVANPRASNRNDLPLQCRDLEVFRSSSHSLLPKQQDNDIRIFNSNYFHHAAACMTKPYAKSIFEDYINHKDEMFGRIDNSLPRRADNDFPGFAYEEMYGWGERTVPGYRRCLEQPHHLSISRSAQLGSRRPYPDYY